MATLVFTAIGVHHQGFEGSVKFGDQASGDDVHTAQFMHPVLHIDQVHVALEHVA